MFELLGNCNGNEYRDNEQEQTTRWVLTYMDKREKQKLLKQFEVTRLLSPNYLFKKKNKKRKN